MNPSGAYETVSPEVSGALRYERIARLEAVLKLRERQHRMSLYGWIGAALVLAVAAAIATLA